MIVDRKPEMNPRISNEAIANEYVASHLWEGISKEILANRTLDKEDICLA